MVAILLRITGEGEVFYQQERIGRDGQSFNLLKFATMLKNSFVNAEWSNYRQK